MIVRQSYDGVHAINAPHATHAHTIALNERARMERLGTLRTRNRRRLAVFAVRTLFMADRCVKSIIIAPRYPDFVRPTGCVTTAPHVWR
jgi:hypothetical protein